MRKLARIRRGAAAAALLAAAALVGASLPGMASAESTQPEFGAPDEGVFEYSEEYPEAGTPGDLPAGEPENGGHEWCPDGDRWDEAAWEEHADACRDGDRKHDECPEPDARTENGYHDDYNDHKKGKKDDCPDRKKPEKPEKPEKPTLPETGTPVPAIAGLGVLLVAVGGGAWLFANRRRSHI